MEASLANSPLSSYTVAKSAVIALRNLSAFRDKSIRAKILQEPGVLARLAKLVSEDDDLALGTIAAQVLYNLVDTDNYYTKKEVAAGDGVVACLIKSFSDDNKPVLQAIVAKTLRKIAFMPAFRNMIKNGEAALKGFVEALFKDENSNLHQEATCILAIIAKYDPETVICERAALAGLVKALPQQNMFRLQLLAAMALERLCRVKDRSMRHRISSEDGLIVALVRALSYSGLRGRVLITFKRLCKAADGSIVSSIINEDGTIAILVGCLSQNECATSRRSAARTLCSLAASKDYSIRRRLVNQEGALAGLLKCLNETQDSKAKLRKLALRALANLADSRDTAVKRKLANEDGAVASLVSFLSASGTPGLQQLAAGALASLAEVDEYIVQVKMATTDGLIAGLAKCLPSPTDPNEQEEAASTSAETTGEGFNRSFPKRLKTSISNEAPSSSSTELSV